MVSILEVSNCLTQPKSWVRMRDEYLNNMPIMVAGAEGCHDLLFDEVSKIIEILDPSEVKKYFKFDKKQRRYLCRTCAVSCEGDAPNLAQLEPNEPTSQIIFCVLCDDKREVIRKKCNDSKCAGNVIDKEENLCLTCGGEQE